MLLRKKNIFTLLMFLCVNSTVRAASDCQMYLSSPVQDYGTINPDELRFSARNTSTTSASLGKRHIQLRVICEEAREMAVIYRSQVASNKAYQFGVNGSVVLMVRGIQLDGESVQPGTVSRLGEIPVVNDAGLILEPEHYVVPVKNQQTIYGKILQIDFEMNTLLPVEPLKNRDDIKLEGRGYFQLG